jgi:uncharacterized protein (TIGR02246 family)
MSPGRLFLTLFVFITGLFICSFDNPNAKNDEAQIREMTESYVQTFSKHDPQALAQYWDKDAEYTYPLTGETVQGREQVAEGLKKWFVDRKADKVKVQIDDIVFPEEGKAIEKGRFQLTYQDNKPPLESGFKADLVKVGDKWLFKRVRQIHYSPAVSNYEHLKELEWFLGNWVDTDEDVTIESINQWVMNKNFLIQRFNMKLYDHPVMKGRQIIGWDPSIQKIRSWIFDSDGGIGEGTWSKFGDKWYVKTSYTLANGDKASAINIYSKKSDNEYTWASVGRDVNGEILPNIEPITIVRKTSEGDQ